MDTGASIELWRVDLGICNQSHCWPHSISYPVASLAKDLTLGYPVPMTLENPWLKCWPLGKQSWSSLTQHIGASMAKWLTLGHAIKVLLTLGHAIMAIVGLAAWGMPWWNNGWCPQRGWANYQMDQYPGNDTCTSCWNMALGTCWHFG